MAILAKCVDRTFVHVKDGTYSVGPVLLIEPCDLEQRETEQC